MNRALLVLAVVVVFVVGFVALRPSGDDDDPPTATTAAPAPASTTSLAAPTATTPEPAAPAPKPMPRPRVPTITVKALKPVGGVRDLEVDQGELLRFRVRSDRAETVHLHGYDVEKPVAPGKPASFSVRAKLTGIFEVELEHSAVAIAEVTVNP